MWKYKEDLLAKCVSKEKKITLLKSIFFKMTILLPWADSYNSENNNLNIICLKAQMKSHTKMILHGYI